MYGRVNVTIFDIGPLCLNGDSWTFDGSLSSLLTRNVQDSNNVRHKTVQMEARQKETQDFLTFLFFLTYTIYMMIFTAFSAKEWHDVHMKQNNVI